LCAAPFGPFRQMGTVPFFPPSKPRMCWRLTSWQWLVALLLAATVWGLVDVRRRGYPYPQSPQEHRSDLTVYTEAGAAFFDGRPPYEVSNPRGWTYLYPPLFALLLAPLHVLPMQDQVTVWFFLSLLFCWGCCYECRRIVECARSDDSKLAAAWPRWFPWLAVAAVAVALLPTLNCLQRGQVGLVKLYLLLLGLRLLLSGRSYRWWFAGGLVLALPIVLKIIPVLPVGFLFFLQVVEWARSRRRCPVSARTLGQPPAGPRLAASTLGLCCGLVLFFLLVPAALIGWNANLRHLDTWGRFMLTKADNGGMDPRSGNSHSARNQSLHNALYRLGNFAAYAFTGGPDDRLVEEFHAPQMVMDRPEAEQALLLARAALGLALLALGARLARGDGGRLNLATGFALACVAMLVVSPVARGHYFMFLAPATLLVPLWLDRHGRPRAAAVMALVAPVLPVLHYVLLPYAGRVGLLGLGTTAWLMAVLLLMARTDHLAPPGAAAAGTDLELPLISNLSSFDPLPSLQ
jgi:hypothetical protein